MTILGNQDFRSISGAVITECDVKILERCNQDNIRALESVTGAYRNGEKYWETSRHRICVYAKLEGCRVITF